MHRVSFRLLCSALAVACYAAPAWAQYNDPFAQTSATSSVQMLPATHTSTGSSYVVTSHAGSCDECCDTCDDACCDTCEDVCCDTCDTCCDVCDDACCEPKSCKTYFAGFEATFLDPHFEDGAAPGTGIAGAILSTSGDQAGQAPLFATEDFDFAFAPRFYAGMVDETGFGARVTYWWFNDTSGTATVGTTFGGGALAANINVAGELELHVLDVEGTQGFAMGNWNMNLGAGLRFAQFNISSNVFGGASDGSNTGTITTASDFSGFGPTISGALIRDIGNGLAVFAKGRFALLYGKTDATGAFNLNLPDVPLGGGVIGMQNGSFANNDIEDFLSVYEIQIGTAYEYQSGANRFFVTAAWEAQLWAGAGGYQELLGSLPQLAPITTGAPLATGAGDVGFSGFTVGVGVGR